MNIYANSFTTYLAVNHSNAAGVFELITVCNDISWLK